MGRKLIRTMKGEVFDGFTRPVLAQQISKVLGVRHCVVGTSDGNTYDIITDEDGVIINLGQGLSVSPPPKENLPAHHQKLKAGQYFFCIDEDVFAGHLHLVYIEDETIMGEAATHGIIAPRRAMHISEYISYLSATQGFWEVLHEECESGIGTQSTLKRQLDAEGQRFYNKSNK
ncbi:hypothetical protein L8P92_04580 [Enterobacter asburiae]|uniref:hypothetical protein n=1 Tax=Enterobacter asburiae TaxID=61645 RepID=UPI0020068C58|nr:hypothetical protein [Enterobacter asburiae]MCK7061197.1 hypothetical protein [Enterobacter asburiae]